jgi:hypothetical protein
MLFIFNLLGLIIFRWCHEARLFLRSCFAFCVIHYLLKMVYHPQNFQ